MPRSFFDAAAYGGKGWQPRDASTAEEIGHLWGACGQNSEWAPLESVLLHRPGPELLAADDPDAVQMLAAVDLSRLQAQHDVLAQAFDVAGVTVHYVEPDVTPPPNLMFVADLMVMTPEGAVLARPASRVRAGEERFVARRLAALGIPILRSVHGQATFEGADAMWLSSDRMLVADGLRTNPEGRAQVAATLAEMGIETLPVGLPYGAMHLMGTLRIVARDLAIAWPGRVPFAAVRALRQQGTIVQFLPDETEALYGFALNFVTLGPRKVLMAAGNPITRRYYESLGIECVTVTVDELTRAAGGIGCLTGVLERELTD
jgi:N-dimethylarginine dimethylaminohydrolase